MERRKIYLAKKKWQHKKWQQGSGELMAATIYGLHPIDRRSIEGGYVEIPEATVLILYGDLGPTGKLVFVYRPETGLPLDRRFFADFHTQEDVEKISKIPRHAQAWISEFLWRTG